MESSGVIKVSTYPLPFHEKTLIFTGCEKLFDICDSDIPSAFIFR